MSRSERMLNDMSAETSSLLRSKKDVSSVSMKEIYLKCKILSGFNTYHHYKWLLVYMHEPIKVQ